MPTFSFNLRIRTKILHQLYLYTNCPIFCIFSQVKQVKGPEMIPSVAFAFGSCFCELKQRLKDLLRQREYSILRLENKHIWKGAETCQISSSALAEKKRKHWRARQQKQVLKSIKDKSGGCWQDHFHGKDKKTPTGCTKCGSHCIDCKMQNIYV